MSTIDWSARVRTALRRGDKRDPDDDVVEELAQHAGAMYDAALAAGTPPPEAEARVEALIARWRADAVALHRAVWRPAAPVPPGPPRSAWGGWRQDLRYALRLVWRRPRPALTAIATLALGIGATTTLFTVAHGALLRPLPWPNASRVVVLRETRGGVAPRFGEMSNAAWLAWERADTLEALSAWSTRVVTLTGRGEAERVRIVAATPSLFQVLGVRPLAGRVIGPGEEGAGVAVLSERLWRGRFNADPAIIGGAVTLDGQARTVVGILAEGDAFPDAETQAVVPLSVPPASNDLLSMSSALALLRPGVTPAQAAAEGTARGRFAPDTGMTTMALFGTTGPIAITARPLQEALTLDVRRPLMLLLIAVGLLLATATINVAGVQLTGFTARAREMSIRGALGAGAGRVARQLLVEASIVALAGGAAGLGLAWLLIARALPALMPADFPRLDALHVDAAVVAFALAVSAATILAVGLVPALRARRLSLVAALAEDGNAPVGAGLRSRAGRARTLVLAAQVAVACVLLVGGSLLARSFVALVSADRGYRADHVLSARLSMPPSLFPEPRRRAGLVDDILARVAAVPGVREAAFTSEIPLVPGGSTSAFEMRSGQAGVVTAQASPRIVSPGYFAALGIATIDGRVFGAADTASSEPAVVVNQAFARRYLPDGAVGARLPIVAYDLAGREGAEASVAGVVADVRYVAHGGLVQPELYYVHRQIPSGLPVQTVTLLVRTAGDPSAAAAALRDAVRAADDRLVAEAIQPLEDRFLATVARPRFYAALLGGFAAAALAIATVGLFGLVSYGASLRARELAVRSALGASRGDLLRVVMGQGLAATVAGIVVGLAAAALGSGLLSAELYGVTPHDPVTFVGVPALLLAVASIACALPARRASRIDPLQLFRDNR